MTHAVNSDRYTDFRSIFPGMGLAAHSESVTAPNSSSFFPSHVSNLGAVSSFRKRAISEAFCAGSLQTEDSGASIEEDRSGNTLKRRKTVHWAPEVDEEKDSVFRSKFSLKPATFCSSNDVNSFSDSVDATEYEDSSDLSESDESRDGNGFSVAPRTGPGRMHDGRRSSLTLMDKYLDCLPSAFGGVLSHSPLHPSGLFQPFDSSYISPRWKTFSRNNAQFSELNSSYETGRSVVKPSRSSRRSKMALKPGSSQTTSGTSVDTTRPEPSSYSNTRSHVSHNSTLLMEDAASLSTSSRPRSESSPRRKEAPCSAPLSFYSSSHSSLPRNRHGPGIDFPPSEPSTQQDRASHPSRPSLSSPDESRNQSTLSHSNSNLGSDPSSLQVPSGRAGSRIFDLPLVPGGNEAEGNGVDTDTEGDGGLDIYDIIADVDGLCYPEEGEDDRERLSYSLGTSANEDGKTLALVKSESEPSRLSAFVASSDSYGTAAKRRSTSPPPPLPEPSSFQPPGTLSALPTSSLAVVGHQIPPPPWAKLPLQAPVPPSLSLHGQWPSRTSRKRKRKTGDGVEVEVSPSSSRGAASTCASALATPASTPMRTRTRTRIRSTNNDTGSEVEHEHEHEHENEAGDDSVDILSTPGHRRHHRVITYRMRTTHGQTVLKEDYMANFLQGVGGEAEDGRRMIKGKAKSYERVEVERERELRPRGLRLREVLEDETDTDEDGDDDEHTGVGGGSSRSGRTRAPSVLTGGPVVDAVKENVDPFGSIDAAGVEQGEVERNLDDSSSASRQAEPTRKHSESVSNGDATYKGSVRTIQWAPSTSSTGTSVSNMDTGDSQVLFFQPPPLQTSIPDNQPQFWHVVSAPGPPHPGHIPPSTSSRGRPRQTAKRRSTRPDHEMLVSQSIRSEEEREEKKAAVLRVKNEKRAAREADQIGGNKVKVEIPKDQLRTNDEKKGKRTRRKEKVEREAVKKEYEDAERMQREWEERELMMLRQMVFNSTGQMVGGGGGEPLNVEEAGGGTGIGTLFSAPYAWPASSTLSSVGVYSADVTWEFKELGGNLDSVGVGTRDAGKSALSLAEH